MLVLTRKKGESVKIGDDITVTVTELGSGQVKLAIEAPRELQVHRQEIYDRIQRERAGF